jgi:hypothetical protein
MPLRALQGSLTRTLSVWNTQAFLSKSASYFGSKLGAIGVAFYGITLAFSFSARMSSFRLSARIFH